MISISPVAFRWMVIVAFLLDVIFTGYWSAGGEWLLLSEGGMEAFQWNYHDAILSEDTLGLCGDLSRMARWFGYIGLLLFWPAGRWVLLVVVVTDVLFMALSGVGIGVPLESTISHLLSVMTIFLLTLSFFSPLAAKFERKQVEEGGKPLA